MRTRVRAHTHTAPRTLYVKRHWARVRIYILMLSDLCNNFRWKVTQGPLVPFDR